MHLQTVYFPRTCSSSGDDMRSFSKFGHCCAGK